MYHIEILKNQYQSNPCDKSVERIKRDVRVIDDKFPDNKTDRRKTYNDLRRKKYDYYQIKHENFPERDTDGEKSARKYNKWRTVQYEKIKKQQGLEKTKLCRSVILGCECKFGARGKCKYAHSVEELVIPMCFFGQRCHCKYTCKFPHTEEERQKMQDEKRAYVKKRMELKQSISNIPVFKNQTNLSIMHNIINCVATKTSRNVIYRGVKNITAERTIASKI